MLICVIFLDPCLVKRTKLFRQPSGSDEGAGAITLQGSQTGSGRDAIRSPAACRRTAIRGRPFLTEHAEHNRFCYYKGGLAGRRNPPIFSSVKPASLAQPYTHRKATKVGGLRFPRTHLRAGALIRATSGRQAHNTRLLSFTFSASRYTSAPISLNLALICAMPSSMVPLILRPTLAGSFKVAA
jgi:hypothetical protein